MISVEQIARVAALFDRYNNALDPFSEDCREAHQDFDQLVEALHTTHGPEIKLLDFRFELVRQCRDYLRKNRP